MSKMKLFVFYIAYASNYFFLFRKKTKNLNPLNSIQKKTDLVSLLALAERLVNAYICRHEFQQSKILFFFNSATMCSKLTT